MAATASDSVAPVAVIPAGREGLAAAQAGWLFALVIVGYPIFGMLAAFMDVPSTTFSIPYRVIVVLYSGLVLALALAARPLAWFPRWLLLFWLIYAVRLSWDTYVADVFAAGPSFLFFVVTGVAPALPLALLADKWDDAAVARKLVIVGAVACGMGVAAELLGLAQARSMIRAEEGRLSYDAVNPILFGHAGLVTLIAGLVAARSRGTVRGRGWALAGACVGGLCLVLAQSRGPFVATAVVALAYFGVRRRWGALLGLAGLGVLTFSLIPWLAVGELTRFAAIDRDESALERLALQSAAINDFLAHPLLGVAYLEPSFTNYPHNIVIEAAMAMGVAGLVLMLALIAKTAWRIVRLIRADVLCLGLIAIDALVGAQFSGSLYGAVPVWATMAVVLAKRMSSPSGESSETALGRVEIARRAGRAAGARRHGAAAS